MTSNATPRAAAPASSQALLPAWTACATHSSASTVNAIITPSIVSLREVITSIGSSASTAAAARPAGTLQIRRTARNSRGTAAVPNSASGSSRLVVEKPSALTLATCSHRSTGGLSIETLAPGSRAPRKKLCQERDMLRTAAS